MTPVGHFATEVSANARDDVSSNPQPDSGLDRDVQGISRGDSSLIHDLTSLLVMPTMKWCESTTFAMVFMFLWPDNS